MTLKERFSSLEYYEVNDETKVFAAHCLQKCAEWFGTPADLTVPYTFYSSYRTACTRLPFTKGYMITFAPEDQYEVSKERHWFLLAHEMYHRCTMKRSGMRRYLWVDEMLAWATASEICSETAELTGYESLWKSCLVLKPAVDLPRVLRRKRPLIYRPYPQHLSNWSLLLGEALKYVMTWEQQCSLAFAKNLDTWLSSLPMMKRVFVEILLKQQEADIERLASYDSQEDLIYFGYALALMHEYDTALALYAMLAGQDRIAANDYRDLASIFLNRGKFDSLVLTMQKAFDLDSSDKHGIELAYALIAATRYAEALPYVEFILAQDASAYRENDQQYRDYAIGQLAG